MKKPKFTLSTGFIIFDLLRNLCALPYVITVPFAAFFVVVSTASIETKIGSYWSIGLFTLQVTAWTTGFVIAALAGPSLTKRSLPGWALLAATMSAFISYTVCMNELERKYDAQATAATRIVEIQTQIAQKSADIIACDQKSKSVCDSSVERAQKYLLEYQLLDLKMMIPIPEKVKPWLDTMIIVMTIGFAYLGTILANPALFRKFIFNDLPNSITGFIEGLFSWVGNILGSLFSWIGNLLGKKSSPTNGRSPTNGGSPNRPKMDMPPMKGPPMPGMNM